MFRSVFLITAFALLALPASAGSLTFSNGKGLWQSTLCSRPVPPAFVGLGSDASAGTLNAATQSYNLFVKQSQDYQACLSAEAKADSEASNALINQTVTHQMQDATNEVERAKGQLFGKATRMPAMVPPPQMPAPQVVQPQMAPSVEVMPQQPMDDMQQQMPPPMLQPQPLTPRE